MITRQIKLTIYFLLLFTYSGYGQEMEKAPTHSWSLLINRVQLSHHWFLTNELHQRNRWFFEDKGQFLLRPSIDYKLTNQLELSLGYTYISTNPEEPYPLKAFSTEHNMWQQALMKFDIGKVHLINRFRQENRWIDHLDGVNGEYVKNGNDYANRFRYRFTTSFDVYTFDNQKSALFITAFDEIWFNQDERLRPVSFARNWAYVGVGYKLDKDTNFQVGYMNQWDKAANTYFQTNIVQFTVQKNFFH
nr:DUF2490 domain-containing protein [Cytophagales bacterium]